MGAGFGNTSQDVHFLLKGGGPCPTDGCIGSLTRNGMIAIFGNEIVTCRACGIIRCARCGDPATTTEGRGGPDKKYGCGCSKKR